MSRRAKSADTPPPEADRIEGQPHPRETYKLSGQGAALARAAHAIRAGRVPSAWLITGPPGVGKATLAYTIARYLLRYGANADGPADLAVAPNDPVSKLMEARAHPGLLVLSRRADDKGKLPTALKVDEVRRLSSFFGLTASAGGWRVAILDTADDMSEEAANALLKNWKSRRRAACCSCWRMRRGVCCPPSARAASGSILGPWTMKRSAPNWPSVCPT